VERSLSSTFAPSILPPAADARDASPPYGVRRRERVLLFALIASLALHIAGGSGALDWLSRLHANDEAEPGPPLRAVLKPPPPPTVQATQAPPPPRAKPRPRQHPARPAPPVLSAVTVPPEPVAPVEVIAPEPPPPAPPPVVAEAPPPPPVIPVEPPPVTDEPLPPGPVVTVPKRIDLVGTLYVGEQNFMIGTGGFSLRHDGNRYEISVLGRAKGLARLLLAGEFSGVSRGAITPEGLQPSEYVEERGSSDRRESATLDWEAGVIRLRDDKVVPIEPPVFDRLSVIMQFYYKPPTADQMSTRVAGTRYVDTYTFKRRGDEAIELPTGIVTTQVWRVDYDDGNPRLELWMSPEYNWLPLKVRIYTRKENGGRFATLQIGEIRVAD
jgi:hypothetical protein